MHYLWFRLYGVVWYVGFNLSLLVERVQNYAARVILDKPPWTRSEELRTSLHWQTLEERRCFRIARLTYKILHKQSPSYLFEKFRLNSDIRREGERNADTIFVERTYSGWFNNSKAWNSLHPSVRHTT